MKYIKFKRSYQHQPVSPESLVLDCTPGEITDVESIIAGCMMADLCMVRRSGIDEHELEVIVIEHDYFTTKGALLGLYTAGDFFAAIHAWKQGR